MNRSVMPRARNFTKEPKEVFIPVSGELFNSMEAGEMTPAQWCVYSLILKQCNWETGVWTGSAYKLHIGWGCQIPLRTIQDNLKSLREKGFLKSFHMKNARGNYRVVIHGYVPRFGPHKGKLLDATGTNDPSKPVYITNSGNMRSAQLRGDAVPFSSGKPFQTQSDTSLHSAQSPRNAKHDGDFSAQVVRKVRAKSAQSTRNECEA